MVENKKALVFIVEDNDAYRVLLGRILEKKGFLVLMFENGSRALDMLKYIKPVLIISDIQMPGMNGFEFHEEVNQKFPKAAIPFIYLSSTNSPEDVDKATRLGAIGMLDKPVTPDVLTSSIGKVLEKIS